MNSHTALTLGVSMSGLFKTAGPERLSSGPKLTQLIGNALSDSNPT